MKKSSDSIEVENLIQCPVTLIFTRSNPTASILKFNLPLNDWDDGDYKYWSGPTYFKIQDNGDWELFATNIQNDKPGGFEGNPVYRAYISVSYYEYDLVSPPLYSQEYTILARAECCGNEHRPCVARGNDFTFSTISARVKYISAQQHWQRV